MRRPYSAGSRSLPRRCLGRAGSARPPGDARRRRKAAARTARGYTVAVRHGPPPRNQDRPSRRRAPAPGSGGPPVPAAGLGLGSESSAKRRRWRHRGGQVRSYSQGQCWDTGECSTDRCHRQARRTGRRRPDAALRWPGAARYSCWGGAGGSGGCDVPYSRRQAADTTQSNMRQRMAMRRRPAAVRRFH